MYYKDKNFTRFDQRGRVFEDDCIRKIKECIFTAKTGELEDVSGTEMDTRKGTDFLFNGIPIDVTYNFFGKDNMTIIEDSYTLPLGVTVKFGIRYGNNRSRFTTPVLVVGFQLNGWFNLYENVLDDIRDDWMTLFKVGSRAYQQYA